MKTYFESDPPLNHIFSADQRIEVSLLNKDTSVDEYSLETSDEILNTPIESLETKINRIFLKIYGVIIGLVSFYILLKLLSPS
jgi:hypothetical protein